jgi:hypothetical protein
MSERRSGSGKSNKLKMMSMTAQEKTPLDKSLPQQHVLHRQQSPHMFQLLSFAYILKNNAYS